MSNNINKSFKPKNKDVRYLDRDFSSLKNNLIEFSKYYYPQTYKDFSDASPGMMFIDMASYVGDVLSYYTDYIFKEGLIYNTVERKNIISLTKYLGYTTTPAKGASGTLDVFQICPAASLTGSYYPDPNYILSIKENMQVSNNYGSSFLTNAPVNFGINSSQSPISSSVYQRDNTGVPTFFLLEKSVNIRSGKLVTKTFTIGSSQPFLDLYLDETNVLEIINVVDSDNNQWYQVDFLAQGMVLSDVPNDQVNQGILSQYQGSVPYILNYLSTSRRFTVNVDQNNRTYLEFGPGTDGFADEIINLSSQQIGVGLSNFASLNLPLDPSNLLQNDTYGLAPQNTTFTVTYTIGGGPQSNSPVNSIVNVDSIDIDNSTDGLTPEESSLLNTVITSLRVNNSDATVGGAGPETNDEIRQNAIALFAAQNRLVTQSDYLSRVYAMPAKYGDIAKAQVITYNSLDVNQNQILTGTVDQNNVATVNNTNVQSYFRNITYDQSNPFAINLYILTYDQNGNLTQANQALVSNLLTYLRQFRMMTDAINVIDAYIINIGVNFTISVYNGYNQKEVLSNAISAVQDFFNINNWEISQNIDLSSLRLQIANVQGVQNVPILEIVNLTPATTNGGDYSAVSYDIVNATKNSVIYNSRDPAIFAVRWPNSDIVGGLSS